MATITPANLSYKDKDGDLGEVKSLTNTDVTLLNNALQDIEDLKLSLDISRAKTDLSNLTDDGKIAIAHNAMPSNVYDELSVGVSGTTYTAPADGYFSLFYSVVTGGYFNVVCTNGIGADIRSINYSNYFALVPVSKGDVVTITHNGADTQSGNYLRFVYLNGSESEQ